MTRRAAVVLLALLGGAAHAQQVDSIYKGRLCNRRFADLRLPTLHEIADSARLERALRTAADGQSKVTKIWFTYDRDGHLKRVQAQNVHQKEGRRALESEARLAAHSLSGTSRDFVVGVVRFSSDGRLEVQPGTVTCAPDAGHVEAVVNFIRGTYGGRRPDASRRTTVIEFWLGADGRVHDAWVSRESGVPELDRLALISITSIEYKPPIVGRTPVPALLQQPFQF